MILEKIEWVMDNYFLVNDKYHPYCWLEHEDKEEEFLYVNDEIRKIFQEFDIKEFNICLEQVYNSISLNIYFLAVSWIEDGKLKVYNKELRWA